MEDICYVHANTLLLYIRNLISLMFLYLHSIWGPRTSRHSKTMVFGIYDRMQPVLFWNRAFNVNKELHIHLPLPVPVFWEAGSTRYKCSSKRNLRQKTYQHAHTKFLSYTKVSRKLPSFLLSSLLLFSLRSTWERVEAVLSFAWAEHRSLQGLWMGMPLNGRNFTDGQLSILNNVNGQTVWNLAFSFPLILVIKTPMECKDEVKCVIDPHKLRLENLRAYNLKGGPRAVSCRWLVKKNDLSSWLAMTHSHQAFLTFFFFKKS